MKRPALILMFLLLGCAPSPAPGGPGIDAWYLFPGEPAPFEGYLLHPQDLEALFQSVGGRSKSN